MRQRSTQFKILHNWKNNAHKKRGAEYSVLVWINPHESLMPYHNILLNIVILNLISNACEGSDGKVQIIVWGVKGGNLSFLDV